MNFYISDRKAFEELTLDEKANMKRLYDIGKGKEVNTNVTYKKSDIEELRELFRFRTCDHIKGMYTVLKHTKFIKYIYIQIPPQRRKGLCLL